MDTKDVEMTPFKVGRKKAPKLKSAEQILELTLEDSLATSSKSIRRGIYASSAGLCARQTAGVLLLDPDKETHRKASAQFYFKLGNAFESVVSRAFERAEILIDQETRISSYHTDLDISGRIDFVIRDRAFSDSLSLVELKTCGKLPDKPRPAHYAQLMTYLVLTGMPRGYVLYISRNVAGWNGELIQKAFLIEPTLKERETVLLNVTLGSEYYKQRALPNKPTSMKRYKCGFCPLIPYCWEDDKDDIIADEVEDPERLLGRALGLVGEFIDAQDVLREEFTNTVLAERFGPPKLTGKSESKKKIVYPATKLDLVSTGISFAGWDGLRTTGVIATR